VIFFWRNYRPSALSLLIFNGIIACIGFYNFALLSRVTSNQFFSNWITFIAFCSVFEMFRGGIFQTGFIRYFVASSSTKEKRQVIHTTFWAGFIFSVIISAIFSLFTLFPLPPSFSFTANFFSIFYLISFPRSFLLWHYQSRQQHIAYFIVQAVTFGSFCICLLLGVLSPLQITWVYILLHSVSGLAVFYVLRKSLFYPSNFKLNTVKRLFSFGKYSLGTQLFINLLKTSDILMISFFMGPHSLALYAIPQKLTEIFDIILRSISTHIYPKLIKLYENGQQYFFKSIIMNYVLCISILFLAISTVFIFFSNELTFLLGGIGMDGASILLFVFLIAKLGAPFIRISGVALDAVNRPKYNFHRYGVMLLINILLNLLCFYFKATVIWIASVNILVGIVGIILGRYFLQKNNLNLGLIHFSAPNLLSFLKRVIVRIT